MCMRSTWDWTSTNSWKWALICFIESTMIHSFHLSCENCAVVLRLLVSLLLLLQEQWRFWYFSRWACYNQKKMAFSQCLTSVISCISTSNGILVWPHTKREYSEALLHYLVQHWDLMKWINWSNKAERSPVWDWEETQIPGRFLYSFDPL